MLIEYIYVLIFKDGGKRAVPIKTGTNWLIAVTIIYLLSVAGFIWSIHSYPSAPANKVINNGIYLWSRNPMYVCYFGSMIGAGIASTSLWLLILLIILIVFTHFSILGEERFCEATYGKEYKIYKELTSHNRIHKFLKTFQCDNSNYLY